jgi:branched-subunit amino acid transport protein
MTISRLAASSLKFAPASLLVALLLGSSASAQSQSQFQPQPSTLVGVKSVVTNQVSSSVMIQS